MAVSSDDSLRKMCSNGYKEALARYIQNDNESLESNKRWVARAEDELRNAKGAVELSQKILDQDRAQMKRIEELGL